MSRIPSLDGLRAISIALVIYGHLLPEFGKQVDSHLAVILLANGNLGVMIFFVISGYLITKLLMREFAKTGNISLKRFYYRRFFRIVPPLYFYIGFVVVTASITSLYPHLSEVLTALTFTRNFDFNARQFMFEHFWSLCIEEQFYLVWPLLVIFSLRRQGPKAAAKIALALIIAAPILRLATFPLIHDQLLRHHVDGLLPFKMDVLMCGCWAALMEGTDVFERLYAKAVKLVWFYPIWCLVISRYLTLRFGNFYNFSVGQSLDGLAIMFTLVWCTRNAESVAGRILNWPPIVHLGLISYSVYIWQTYFLHPENTTILGRFPLNLLCIFAAAEFSYYTVERLSRMARDRWEPLICGRREEKTVPLNVQHPVMAIDESNP